MDAIADYDYALPPERIAHEPANPRDAARLLRVGIDGTLHDAVFRDLPSMLEPGDLLVVNETRVAKARLRGAHAQGGNVEVMISGVDSDGSAMFFGKPAKRLVLGSRLRFGEHEALVVRDGRLRFDDGVVLDALLEERGEVPLPPYIEPPPELDVERAYQTVFARVDGSIAAPTASLHFTERVLAALRERGVTIVPLVLDVGLGTFAPVRAEKLADHAMHEERFDVPLATAQAIAETRSRGGRIVAAGTTVVRALESAANDDGTVAAGPATTRLFIRPGYRFRAVDALITNFHVPKSTLLVLVSTFAGRDLVLRAYLYAIESGYRFFSFGDAMLLERAPVLAI